MDLNEEFSITPGNAFAASQTMYIALLMHLDKRNLIDLKELAESLLKTAAETEENAHRILVGEFAKALIKRVS